MLAKTCLLHTNEGVLWEAKIIRKNSNSLICEGDWPQFVVYHKLRPGDVLLFFLVDKSTFLVVPYTQKSGRNFHGRQPFKELSSSSEEEEEEDIEPSRNSKESSDSVEESIDPSSCSKNREYPSYSHLDHAMSGVKSCLSFIFSTIKSFDAVEKLVRDKWKQMSDAEKAPYIAETEKRRVEYAKVLNSYNQLMAAGYAEAEKRRVEYAKVLNSYNQLIAAGYAEAEKRRVEYAKVLNSYNQLMAAGYAEAEKPDKSRSEVDPSSDSKEGDKSNAKANYVFHMKKKAPGLKKLRRLARGLDIPKRPTSAYFIFMEEFRKQFRELNPSIKSIAVVGKAGGSRCQMLRKLLI
ncbi:hypothetical protein KY285_016007 [Solanum tuberosum]|nr:hypothetical protein KY284_016018 [Solanum tuberosum]KAH0701729.1 hypothetical protein KY285_016007 [Solanum tuberosum]